MNPRVKNLTMPFKDNMPSNLQNQLINSTQHHTQKIINKSNLTSASPASSKLSKKKKIYISTKVQNNKRKFWNSHIYTPVSIWFKSKVECSIKGKKHVMSYPKFWICIVHTTTYIKSSTSLLSYNVYLRKK